MPNTSYTFLDYASTTPVDPRVMEEMEPYFSQVYGNSSSIHKLGQQAEAALESSRLRVAKILGSNPDEVIFTSCGSESDNLALRGVAFAERASREASHILVSPVEHPAVINTAHQLRDMYDFEVEFLSVDRFGMVNPDEVAASIRSDTAIVSVIYGNNEIGTINPIAEIGKICRERGVRFHTDAVQAAAHLNVDVNALNVDLMSIGAHKFYGPKGVGALYVREGTEILPVLTGGGQESGLRAGTHNTPYIVGLARAFERAQDGRQERSKVYSVMRDHIIAEVSTTIPLAQLTGHPVERLPNHASFVFKDVDGNSLLMMLDVKGFACSSGSACKTGDPEPSNILLTLGLPREWALGSLRVTLGKSTQKQEIEQFLDTLKESIHQARKLMPA